jgi:hypothetical protein
VSHVCKFFELFSGQPIESDREGNLLVSQQTETFDAQIKVALDSADQVIRLFEAVDGDCDFGDRGVVDLLVKFFKKQPIRLKDDVLERSGVGLLQNLKQVSPEKRFASGQAQGLDARRTDLVEEFHGAIGTNSVLPA